jgi:hypothetical protein
MAELSEYSENKSCVYKNILGSIFFLSALSQNAGHSKKTLFSPDRHHLVSVFVRIPLERNSPPGAAALVFSLRHITYAIKAPNNPRGFRVYRAPMARKITAQNHARSRRRKNSPAPWAKLWSCKTREKERAPGCKKHSVSLGFSESSAGAIFYH